MFVTITHLVPFQNEHEVITDKKITILNTDTIKRIECDVQHWKGGSDIKTKYMIVCEMGKQSWDASSRTMSVFLSIYEYYTDELPKELQP